jgi:hypothetical protein
MDKRQQASGRIGGLTAWSLNDAEVMVGPAHRGFRERFRNLVDPDRTLPEAEREARADRARRAHMLTLAAKSAAARKRKAARADSRPAAEAPVELIRTGQVRSVKLRGRRLAPATVTRRPAEEAT